MKEIELTYLRLDGMLTLADIERLVNLNMKEMCLESSEITHIQKASQTLSSPFLNIIESYHQISDVLDSNGSSALLIRLADRFTDMLKKEVSKSSISKAESTGLLITWVQIVIMLNHSARNFNKPDFQFTTRYLEQKVHQFAMGYLNLSLNTKTKNFCI